MEKYASQMKDLAPQDVVTKAMVEEISAGRGCGPNGDYFHLHVNHLPSASNYKGLREMGKIFAGVDILKQPLPVSPIVHYNMGGIPTNHKTQVWLSKTVA